MEWPEGRALSVTSRGPDYEVLLVGAGVVEAALERVPEQGDRLPGEFFGLDEPAQVAVSGVQREQAVNQVGVVVQEALRAVL